MGIGDAALTEHGFRVGDTVSGVAKHVENPALVPVDFYRASKLAVEKRGSEGNPPWYGPGPDLERYRAKTPRALAGEALSRDPCRACYWGCRVQVDSPPDYDRPLLSACFGPPSCPAFMSPDGTTAPARSVAKKKAIKKKTTGEKASRRKG